MVFAARDEEGRTILISEGRKYQNYYCPDCNDLMIIRDGQERSKHFSHKTNRACTSDTSFSSPQGESFQHRQGKELLKLFIERKHKISIEKECCNCFTSKVDLIDVENVKIYLEYRLEDGSIADIALVYPDGKIILLEVLYSHKTIERNFMWYEIKAEDILNSRTATCHYFRCNRDNRRCKGECLSMKDIALKLGYLAFNPIHSFEELIPLWKNKKITYEWGISPISDKNMSIWRNFEQRKRCIVCCKSTNTKNGKPYCINCYRRICNDEMVSYTIDTPDEIKNTIVNKYSFLYEIPHSKKQSYKHYGNDNNEDNHESCVKCKRVLDCSYASSRPFFFYGLRNICYMCVDGVVGY